MKMATKSAQAGEHGASQGVGALRNQEVVMLRSGFDFYWAHSMPNKHNDDRRHHIPKKMLFKVQNRPEYGAGHHVTRYESL